VPRWLFDHKARVQISGALGQEKGSYVNVKHPGYHDSNQLWEGDAITFYVFKFSGITPDIFMMGSWKS
jgi:hypothetical protein